MAAVGSRDGSMSARSAGATRRKGELGGPGAFASTNPASQNFLKMVERTTDAFVGDDDTTVEDVRRSLLQVRQQYDSVHHEAEKKEAELRRVREQIRTFDMVHGAQQHKEHDLDGHCEALGIQYKETLKQIRDTQTNRYVYEHMLARIQKEQAILKQKMLRMEDHLSRKTREVQQILSEQQRITRSKVQNERALAHLQQDSEVESRCCQSAREAMEAELDRRKEANKRRAEFDSWRNEVALEAANEAFNASAGRLRKLYAIEKLAGNCLQKITFEQVERSQNTEDGFQKIRDVTGLADVMDIVHKFLNREVEQEQLKGSVKEAEVRLETLRQEFDSWKRETEGVTFDPSVAGRSGDIYKDIEQSERSLNDAMEEHEHCRMRLQKTTMQVDHMKRWATRIGQLLGSLEEPVKVEGPADLAAFFRRFESAVEKFVGHVGQQIQEGKITRKALVQVMTHEYNAQARLLTNDQFKKYNCRVPATADGRPASQQGSPEDDPGASFQEERDRCKRESDEHRRAEEAAQQKKRQRAP